MRMTILRCERASINGGGTRDRIFSTQSIDRHSITHCET